MPVSDWLLAFSNFQYHSNSLVSMNGFCFIRLDPSSMCCTLFSSFPCIERVSDGKLQVRDVAYLDRVLLHGCSCVSVANVCVWFLLRMRRSGGGQYLWWVESCSKSAADGKDTLLLSCKPSCHLQFISLLFGPVCSELA